MNAVTVVGSMLAGACLTLAMIHLPVWGRTYEGRAGMTFSLAAVCTVAIAFFELSMLHTEAPAIYESALKWVHLPVSLLLVTLTAFTYLYLQAGRVWLAVVGLGLRLVSTPFNFTAAQSLDYGEANAVQGIPLLGEQVSIPIGVANLWMLVSQLGGLLLIAFVVDATVTVWRRGQRGIGVGCCVSFFMLAEVGRSVLVFLGHVESPLTDALFSLGVIGVMGYAVSLELGRARELEIEMREREQEAALAADAANLGMWSRDIGEDSIRASEKWRELFGFTSREPLNIERLLQRIHPDDRAPLEHRMIYPAGDQGEYHAEYRIVLPNGKVRWIAQRGRIEFDARHRPIRTRGASVDITTRKQAEQEMLRLRQDIAHVGRVSVMGQLAATLAHEINQPLGAILRNAEAAALFMQNPAPDLAEIGAILEDIRKDDQRASAVIDRMRALLRRQAVEMITLDVNQLLHDVSILLRPDAAARRVTLQIDLPGRVAPVLGDRVQLQQVLLNLILNGMDALEDTPGSPRRVSVNARRASAAEVEISIADTGRGLPLDRIDRVFDPFFSTKAEGIGMGLSISRSIVEAHRGRLWAENNIGGGATFRFTLPIAEKSH